LTTISNIRGLSLDAGASYFLQVSPGSTDTFDMWNLNNTGATALVISTSPTAGSLSAPITGPAFEVQGVAPTVPLPGTVWLLLSGLVAIALAGCLPMARQM